MPFIDFSTGVWAEASANGTEWCTTLGRDKSGRFDPSNLALVMMEAGLMKVAGVGTPPIPVLTIVPITCVPFGQMGSPIPKAICWILLPESYNFVRFQLMFSSGTLAPTANPIKVLYYSGASRDQLVRQDDYAVTASGDSVRITYSDLCVPIRLVVIEVTGMSFQGQNAAVASLFNVQYEYGLPWGGKLLFVSAFYCMIKRGLVGIRRLLRFGG